MGKKIAVVGAGGWGTALSVLLAEKGYDVWLYARRAEKAHRLRVTRENEEYLPGVKIPEAVHISAALEEVVKGARDLIFAVPSHCLRETVRRTAGLLEPGTVVISGVKGLEVDSLGRMSEVIAAELPEGAGGRIAVISGPNHCEEVGRFMPSATVAASASPEVAEYVQDLLMTPFFRVYVNLDVTGVELGGALKNIIAIGVGICEGLGLGDNTRAALISRGLVEMGRVGIRLGARALTFAGLSGLGDLVATCASRHSRNRRAGVEIGRGKKLEEVLASTKMVVEGVRTTQAACALSDRYGVSMPIAREIYEVLFRGKDPRDAVASLMTRGKKYEMEEVAAGGVQGL